MLYYTTIGSVKNIGGKKVADYSNSPSFFANFYYFHNIPYANGLQFTKVFSAKLPTVLIHQTSLLYSVQTYWTPTQLITFTKLAFP